ncbi:MAG TPA: DUF4388 domain-containing protein [Anaeromyxobacteraceae bacterium]|nr:DUF4388 domain-containing protein [Anaeromyxobacteraceae bacterium]
MRAKLAIGAEGVIVVPPREAEALAMAPGADVEIVSARGAFGLIRRAGPPQSYFAGSLAALSVPEAIQVVHTSLKSGVLLLAYGSDPGRGARSDRPEQLRRRSIYFREGQVVFASSSERAERLGPVLLRHGIIGQDDLERAAHLVKSGRPLGQVLVDQGILDSGQLYEGLTIQVREILLGACLESEGEFAFLEGPHDEASAVKLPERTRDLLLEGLRRVAEADELARQLGGRGAILRRAGEPAEEVGEAEAAFLDAVDGDRTAAECASAAGLGLLEGLRAASALVAAGALEAPGPEAAAEEGEEEVFSTTVSPAGEEDAGPAPARPFETYRRIFRRVYEAVLAVQPEAQRRFNSYFDRLSPKQQPVFEGVWLDEAGDMDVAQILVNVNSGGAYKGAAARARALEALEDLLAFMLFEAKNCLPRSDAEALLREVGRMQMGKA